MITLRFVTCHDPVSDTIRRAEMGFWASHVEALMPDGALLGAHYDGGVEARPRDYDKGQWSKELYVRVPCDPAAVQAFEDFLIAQIGKPYDMGAIGKMAVGMLTGEDL